MLKESSVSQARAAPACWRYGVLLCNSFMVFGVYFFLEIPVGLQNELMNSHYSNTGANNTGHHINCKVCLALGEVRYNLLFSVTRWASVAVCLPSGIILDKLGNGRSAVLFTTLSMLGSVLFAVGSMSIAPVTTPMYILMASGYGMLAFGDMSLRLVQARVVAHCFPEATFTALAFASLGYCGQGISLYVTPYIATCLGLMPALWLGPVSCGLSMLCAVGLAFLLHLQPSITAEDKDKNKTMTLTELRELPGSFWLLVLYVGFSSSCWNVKQANLSNYLMLRYGYTMTDASRITGASPTILLLSPFICFILTKIDCDGIMLTFFQSLMLVFYALLGFCSTVNILAISLADGICLGTLTAASWQIILILCPASHVGTLGGLMYLVRNAFLAVTFIISGYILQRQSETDTEEALHNYKHFNLMLVTFCAISVICGMMMNLLDIRKFGNLNARVRRWQQSDKETVRLISMNQPSSKYSDDDKLSDESMTTTCNNE